MAGKTGVYPCYENQFQAGAAKEGATSIADMETFSVKFDNGVEEWYPFDTEGWVRRLATAKSITISVSGKRNIGDTGNDYVFNKTFKNGRDAEGYFGWTFPDGTSSPGMLQFITSQIREPVNLLRLDRWNLM